MHMKATHPDRLSIAKRPKKRPHQSVVRTTVTITPVLFEALPGIISKGGYTGLSDFLQAQIRREAKLDAVPTL